MAPKKQKLGGNTRDIRTYFGKENVASSSSTARSTQMNETPSQATPSSSTARRKLMNETPSQGTPSSRTARRKLMNETPSQKPTCSPLMTKDKNGSDSGEHSHHFTVKLSSSASKEFTVHCDQPRTLLEVLKSDLKMTDEIKTCEDEKIIIQIGKEDRESIVASHFPCSCVDDGESVILFCKPEAVEKSQTREHNIILPKESYSVFYIDKEGGLNTKTKQLFRSNAVKRFKFLRVYGEKGVTVEEALKKDGRFIDDLNEFTLSDNKNPGIYTEHTQKVDNLHQKAFKICLPLMKQNSGSNPRRSISDVAHMKGISVKRAIEEQRSSGKQIEKEVRAAFPDLREWMEIRFPANSYQTKLNLQSENYKDSSKPFKKQYIIDKLFKLAVCKIIVKDVCTGTGFVLFDRLILTNAHLLKNCVEGKSLKESVEVFALFNYKEPAPNENYFFFSAEKTLVDIGENLDYAILELNPDGQRSNQQANTENIKVPPGLLEKIGPVPKRGEACLIGHPGGDVKQMDPTFIIEAEKREQAVNDHFAPYKDTLFAVQLIDQIKNQGIKDIMMGGKMADKVVTYKTFMYHGSSGSAVFDAHCQVFGLHTAGYTYGFPGHEKSVFEFAQPVLTIIEKFVSNLKASGNKKLLERVEEMAKENPYIKKILHPEPADLEEPMELS